MPTSRRDVLRIALLAGGATMLPSQSLARADSASLANDAQWIDGDAPVWEAGQSFGLAWPRGALRRIELLGARREDGSAIPVQSWPLAYWPDGSIKWSSHAIAANALDRGRCVRLEVGRNPAPDMPLRVTEADDAIVVQVGETRWRIPRTGSALVSAADRGGKTVLRNVHLVARRQDVASSEEAARVTTSSFTSRIERVSVEQRGPIRAVIKIEGMHADETRQWLPFSVRLYFTAGSDAVRLIHSFIWDGDSDHDFLSGLGVRAHVPLAAALHDRHVRFATDRGIWAEAVRPLTGLRRDTGEAFRAAQIARRETPSLDTMASKVRDLLEHIPAWGDFRLTQPNADGFSIVKRTRLGRAPIQSFEGDRARGFAYVGTPQGGAAIGLAYFWQRHPAQLDIDDAAGDEAGLTAWLWSPDAPAMDVRSYRDVLGMEEYKTQNLGLDITYEDYEPGWDSAKGIARTSELWLWALPATPDEAQLEAMAVFVARPARLLARPEQLHRAGVLGDWSLPDRGTPLAARIEDQNDLLLAHYRDEIERRRWYGFWNHGDVMHAYDTDRHQWRYDIGGYAWDNSELSTDLWLWYSYLRTGRADLFRMAEAMTRHTGEVDVYHLGPWVGLGTRHGVQHWSDSSKQPRVSNAAYRRIYYYLTGDERVGDLMRALVRSDATLARVNIGRKVDARAPESLPPGGTAGIVGKKDLPEGQFNLGFGTSWASLVAAWFTEWERTRDTRWRDRILAGMNSIAALPRQWWAGGANFELATGRFVSGGDTISVSHLNAVFGAVEIMSELLPLVHAPAYKAAWIDYCAWYNAPAEAWQARFHEAPRGHNLVQSHSRLTAYAARQRKDSELSARAWRELLGSEVSLGLKRSTVRSPALGEDIPEIEGLSTNGAAQWGLAAIQNLALVADSAPTG
ncbi:Tat pathway signal sequence domain protein [Sphingomonas sanguinis]|uniref:exo-rhamnogalacturonan lyase family protein n=1 Tax=Sphingomonas sp. LC-1 TaxID=3110957 RepID=UPI0021BA89B1|nr:Tat pathway signal sequence domain protein [Sphingomonas sp. LC-1]MCT8003814.1 Tat pathway signal sequence domain protein [Sphingomonas sp. LC-1]